MGFPRHHQSRVADEGYSVVAVPSRHELRDASTLGPRNDWSSGGLDPDICSLDVLADASTAR